MPRIDDAHRTDRKTVILDAAERCFARSGFHGASMAQICAEAGMSPGNLYRYFPSKEALTEGLIERDLAEATASFSLLGQVDDIWTAFSELGRHYLVEQPREEVAVWIETMAEVSRNPQIAALRKKTDEVIHDCLFGVLKTAKDRGLAAPHADIEAIVQFMMTYADGLLLRRVRDPHFDASTQIETMFAMTRAMMGAAPEASNDNRN
ncbi:MAG: TetR/AcrR family transcriptional regulator [Alphaproteobacteria bacterium]|jgi:AcrR family transcriptional regulator